MKASLTNYKQSPRKVRLVADMIRGKSVAVARDSLVFLAKKSSPEIIKLLNSAVANARMQGMNPDDLIVKTISVDKGSVIKRFMPKARGRAAGIRRTMSHVNIELGMAADAKPAKVAKTAKKSAKKAAK
ncbi:MAG: 50S ribosomal protein L22 [Patescibacteria group bacterium]